MSKVSLREFSEKEVILKVMSFNALYTRFYADLNHLRHNVIDFDVSRSITNRNTRCLEYRK